MTSIEYLRDVVEKHVSDHGLLDACRKILDDERFAASPASARKHQPYVGGLADHTAEVMRIALNTAAGLNCRLHVMVTAILWHDYGKVYEYIETTDHAGHFCYRYKRHRWSTRHLARSYAEFVAMAKLANVGEDLMEEVGHCILAHHGRQEYGSPVEPLSIEAYIIHVADTLSAKFTNRPHPFVSNLEWDKDPNRSKND